MDKADDMRGKTETEKPKKGVIKQFLGVVLLSLGLLNAMLAFKGAFEAEWFNYVLMGVGGALLATGVRQSGR